MSTVQSKIPRLTKKQEEASQEKANHMESITLLENDQEMAQIMDFEFRDVTTIITDRFKELMEDLDAVVDKMKESLLNDMKKILGISAMSEMKNSKNVSPRKEWQRRKHSVSQNPGLVEKIGNSKSKTISQVSKRLGKSQEHSTCQGKELFQNTSENVKAVENMQETMSEKDDQYGNCNTCEVIGESTELKEDGLVKGMRRRESPHHFTNKGNSLKTSREENGLADEGAVFRLAADFSSATLDVSKQWSHVFNLLRENGFEPEFLCQVKLAFNCDGEMRTFSELQSLSKFASQKPFMRELLKVLPERKKTKRGRRRYRFREKSDQTIPDSKCGSGEPPHEGLSFLFIKEVKVPKSGENRDFGTQEEESSVWKEKEDPEKTESSELEEEREEDSELEGVEKASGFAGEGDETSVLEREEETSGLEEEEEEGEEVEEGDEDEGDEEAFGLEEEEEQWAFDSSYHHHTMVVSEPGVEEIAMVGLEVATVPSSHRGGALCPPSAFASGFTSVEMSSDEQKHHSWTDESIASGIIRLLNNTEEDERDKTSHTAELMSKGAADSTQETKDFGSVISIFKELQEGIGNIKHYHPEVLQIKSSIDALNSRIDVFELRMNNLEDQIEDGSRNSVDPIQMAKHIINKERLRDIEDTSRSANIRLIGIPENYNKENGAEDIIKEIIEENFPELKRDSSLEIVSAYRVPSKFDENRLTPRHILVKFWNSHDKEKILRLSREREEITYRGTRIRLTADLSLGTLDARSKWANIIRVLQEEGFKPRILYPAKLAFNFEGKTKIFFDIEEFKDFIFCIPSLKGLLENIL